jgi:tetratricopeptide (TPR) repeat protein
MKHAAILALALLAACAAPQGGGTQVTAREAARPRQDLVALSREMTAIDLATARGDAAAERQRRVRAAEAEPGDPVARFLAVYARPRGEDRWAAFHALAKELPGSALGHVGMAGVYVEWRTLDQVDRAVAAALEREPDCWLAVLHRAQAQERRERRELAAADYRVVLAADPANPEAHLGLARIARGQGDADVARLEAEAALVGAPGHVGALSLLSDLALAAGDAEIAAARLAELAEASPRDRAARLTLAKLHRAAGRPALARDQLRAAVALKEDAEGLAALAAAARDAGDAATELWAVERLSAVDPSAAEWRRIGEIRLAAGDWAGAEDALRRCLARDPRDAAASAGLARVHLRRGEALEAVGAFRAGGDAAREELAALERRLNLDRVSRKDLAQLQRAVQALVDRTYRARAAEVPSLSGVLRVRVTVGASGEATRVDVLEDSIHDPDVRACAYWNLRDAAYPPSKPGRFTFAFSFGR